MERQLLPNPARRKSPIERRTTRNVARRARTSRACDQCREKKNKCDGGSPSCTPCLHSGLTCLYVSNTKKRGHPAGYVKVLESLWALAFTLIPNSKTTAQKLLDGIKLSQDSEGKVIVTSKDVESPSILRQKWLESRVRSEIERLVANLGCESNENRASSDQIQGDSICHNLPPPGPIPIDYGNWEFPESDIQGGSSQDAAEPPSCFPVTTQPNTTSADRNNSYETPASLDDCPGIETHRVQTKWDFPSNPIELIEMYFACTHCCFPIVEKYKVFQVAYSPKESTVDNSTLSVLWAILVHSSHQLAKSEHLSLSEGPRPSDSNLAFKKCYSTAIALIPNDDAHPTIGYVQALMILSLVQIDRGSWPMAWVLIGRATRLALLLSNEKSSVNSKETTGSRTRALMAIFILDTIISHQLDHKPTLRSEDIEYLPPIDENDREEWEPNNHNVSSSTTTPRGPPRILSIFNNYVELMKIFNHVTSNITRASNTEKSERILKHSMEALESWREKLPKHCMIPQDSNPIPCVTAQALNLNLMYESAKLTIILELSRIRLSVEKYRVAASSSIKTIKKLNNMYSDTFGAYAAPSIFAFYSYKYDMMSGYLNHNAMGGSNLPKTPSHSHQIHDPGSHDSVPLLPDSQSYLPTERDKSLDGTVNNYLSFGDVPSPRGNVEFPTKSTEDLSSSFEMQWPSLSSQFMQNLGFTLYEANSAPSFDAILDLNGMDFVGGS